MYRIYYIKNNYMFRHLTSVIFRLRNEKKLSKQLYSTFFISQPEDDQCQVPKHVVVLYVINSIRISTIFQLC